MRASESPGRLSSRQRYPPCASDLGIPGACTFARAACQLRAGTYGNAMRIEQFTLKAQEALQAAQTLARRMGSPEVEPEHLAKALLTQEQGVAEALLRRIGTDPGLLQGRVDEALDRLPKIQGGDGGRLSQRLLRDLDKAEDEAKQLKDEYVSSEHLLIALAQDRGAIGEALKSSGITRDRVLTVLKDLRGGKRVTTQEA